MAALRLVVIAFLATFSRHAVADEDSQGKPGFCNVAADSGSQGIACQPPVDANEHVKSVYVANDSESVKPGTHRLVIFTVASDETDGFKRFARSAKIYGLQPKILGMHEEWLGGDMAKGMGGGYKVRLLKKALEDYKDDASTLIMFVDSYDVIFTASEDEILRKFSKFNCNVVFSAEGFCWPDKSLAEAYPIANGERFLNSGACPDFSYAGFIGYAPQVYSIVSSSDLEDAADDQLFYTKVYLNEDLRRKWGIKLDHKAEIFQNLNGAVGDVELLGLDSEPYLHNSAYGTTPLVIHGNGPSKVTLNSLGNYLAKSWNDIAGCRVCYDTFSLSDKLDSELPKVLIAIFVEHPTPFLKEAMNKIYNLNYPKEKIHLFVHNAEEFHDAEVNKFVEEKGPAYHSVKYLDVSEAKKEWHARNLALEECLKINCDYAFFVDSEVHIDNPGTLRLLIETNRTIVAPLLSREKSLWSNFWGSLSADGYYARSHDYVSLVKRERKGIWNVPLVNGAYLINGSLVKSREKFPSFINGLLDPDMAFCKNMRDKGIFMFMTNMDNYGHLVNAETFDIRHKNPDFYEIYSNQKDWERRYLHENYTKVLDPSYKVDMPCPDVYWFPVVSEIFCEHLIQIMENFGKWSSGTNEDERLAGGYENVPTRDIHMNQVGLEQHWLFFLREYIRPVQEKVFLGYFHDPPKAIMNFVVRYHPEEQYFLRPHHDSSTYTINIALNRPRVDYEGGGCHFLRYNCSVIDLKRGWSLMHPGRLTHYHEGLAVTKGTRYIMVSFVDP
ncbi:procollagen-lysine,2-oxoglutarate 5-dioxygenase isoform X1 [Dermacentor silvarum]|uniref:procollagen-lysine,2-oxoglutarate 5-dioxygenase isoform X1 n=1 Tax=Dermacentor silvarum TaxID=543639 RepID=UPI001898EC19|nr:procollagen-lysine,2-oxoglutarate 5-dioxygenase isoform X1 [Dermacentor silvarum]